MSISKATLVIFFLSVTSGNSTSYCDQELYFLLKPEGETCSFWIGEKVLGECQYAQIIHVFIDDDNPRVSFLRLDDIRDWPEVIAGLKRIKGENPIDLENNANFFFLRFPTRNVTEPAQNRFWLKEFDLHIEEGGRNGETWNARMGNEGVLLPRFIGIKAKLLYYYPGGLYINYHISKVYYFENSSYLLILTNQPMAAVGNDTMHGFMIFRIDE